MKEPLYINHYKNSLVINEHVFTYAFPQWKIIYNAPNPDIVFIQPEHVPGILNQVMSVRIKFGWKPLICVRYGELERLPQVNYLDYVFSYNATDSQNCQWMFGGGISTIGNLELFNSNRIAAIQPKTHFCNFVYSNSHDRNTPLRDNFCQQLMKYKHIDCPGKSMNNMPCIIEHGEVGGMQAKLDFIANYKFTIAFENTSRDYYISEKILHPLIAGSVPIYWGSPKIAEYFNPECFINCHDYNSFSQVIEKIKEIDNDPKLYQKYVDADPILPNSRLYQVHQQFIDRLAHIKEEVLQRRKAAPPNKLMGLWKLLMLGWENKYLILEHPKIRSKLEPIIRLKD